MKRKTFMMLGGKYHIAATRLPGESGPVTRKSRFGFEQRNCGTRVGVRISVHRILNPLHAAVGANDFALPGAGQS